MIARRWAETPVQPVSIDDLTEGLFRIAAGGLAGEFNLGLEKPLSMRELYGLMLEANSLRRMLVPAPAWPAMAVAGAAAAAGVDLPFSRDNVLGLKVLREFNTAASLRLLGLPSREACELPWRLRS